MVKIGSDVFANIDIESLSFIQKGDSTFGGGRVEKVVLRQGFTF